MQHNYKILLPDGQEHKWKRGLAELRKTYPDAIVTHTEVLDALGQGTWVPFRDAPRPAPVADAGEKPERKAKA